MFITSCVVKNRGIDDYKKPHPTHCLNCLMNDCVVQVVSVGVSLRGSYLRVSHVDQSDRWLIYLQAQSLRISVCICLCAWMCPYISQFKCEDYGKTSLDTAPIPSIVLRFPFLSFKLKAWNKGRGYCGCVCACACICVCALRVGGGCVKEEVLSGTEAFCRCCREEGVNGKFFGYPSYSALWLAKVCHMWPHPKSVSVLDL